MALLPGLLATEFALLVVALLGGWLPEKLKAWGGTIGSLPRLLGERRAIAAGGGVSAADFAAALTADLDSSYLGRASSSPLLAAALGGYWAVVRAVLGSRTA